MKKLILAGLLNTTFFIASPAFADTFQAEAPIEDVTVYKGGGAQIVRRGMLHLPAGDHIVILSNLHGELLQSHIGPHAASLSTGSLVTGLKIRTQASNGQASPIQQELTSQIAELGQKIIAIQNIIAANDMRLSFIKTISDSSGKKDPVQDFSSLQKTLEFVGENATKILMDTQAHQQKIQTLIQQKKALERELSRSGALRDDYQQAVLTIHNDKPQNTIFTFSYFVEDARWSLETEASLSSTEKRMALSLTANISQTTGENWENIQLALSNARPTGYVGDVTLSSQFVSFQSENQKLQRMTMERLESPNFAGYADKSQVTNNVTEVSTKFDRRYVASEAATILSTGEEEQLTLIRKTSPVNLVTRAVPYKNLTPYVFADTVFTEFPPVRDVSVTLTRDGHYAGKGRWPDLIAKLPLELPFAEDTGVSIDYTEQAPEDGSTGFINKQRVEEKYYLIKIVNNHGTKTEVEIYDRYPVSTHEDIEITPTKRATKPVKNNVNDKPGVVKWRKTLDAGETWEIHHSYKILYPSDKELQKREQ